MTNHYAVPELRGRHQAAYPNVADFVSPGKRRNSMEMYGAHVKARGIESLQSTDRGKW
jgi:hypothetical protein